MDTNEVEELVGDRVPVPLGLVELTLRDTTWRMDLLGAIRALDRFKQTEAAQADLYAYCDQVKELVKAAGGPDINDTEADWLYDKLYATWLSKKKQRQADMSDKPESPSSTE